MFFSGHRVLNFHKYMLICQIQKPCWGKKKIRGNLPTKTWSLNCLSSLSPDRTRHGDNVPWEPMMVTLPAEIRQTPRRKTGGVFSAKKSAHCKGHFHFQTVSFSKGSVIFKFLSRVGRWEAEEGVGALLSLQQPTTGKNGRLRQVLHGYSPNICSQQPIFQTGF